MAKFKVAAVQTYSLVDGQKNNLEAITASIREAAGKGAKLIVFPECMNNGYVWQRSQTCQFRAVTRFRSLHR